MGRLGHRLAHPGGRPDDAIQPGVADHLDDGRNAPALLADQRRPGAVELDLARGVGPVAELVLQALEGDSVALPVGGPPGQGEAGQTARRLGQNQEQVAHGRRAEPLVPGQPVAAAVPPATATVVLARTSLPPCFSVMAMPARAPALAGAGRDDGS